MKKLESNYGPGSDTYWREFGDFEVRYADQLMPFHKLEDAISFYNQINDEAFIWDHTEFSRLIEGKTWVELEE